MELAPATLRTYRCAIHKLELAGYIDFAGENNSIQLNSTLPEYLTKEIVNQGSRKVYVSAILNEIRNWTAEQKKPYTDMAQSLRKSCSQEAVSQTLKEHRTKQMLKWFDVLALNNKAKEALSPQDYLIYCLYTLQPPVRADYANMKIIKYYSKKYKDDTTQNYCLLHKDTGKFIFNVYKTAKRYGQVIVDIDDDLLGLIQRTCTGASVLLPGVNTNNTLSKRVISIFETLAGKKMGIGLLRHSYITSYLATTHRITDKAILAYCMMHSWVQQEAYHIISDDE